ncbi:MAG: phosphoenolpyruvate synthase [Nitrospira sp.]|nr:phosphoenolpyruvate synthase [Nitrospira sp.]
MDTEDKTRIIHSGIPFLDDTLQGLQKGDNVVWKVDNLEDYAYFAKPFARQALFDRRRCIYMRFAHHPPIFKRSKGLKIIKVDPSPGFDLFSSEVSQIIEKNGRGVFYIFDNLSALVAEWATDDLLSNFFQVTCPYLFELDTIAYFALTRGKHAHSAVARIRDTTQILIDVFRIEGEMYVHPLKVWGRYSPRMFLPRSVSGKGWVPVFQSGKAAAVSAVAQRQPLHILTKSIAPWESVYRKLIEYCETERVVDEKKPEIAALKQELSRMMIGNHPELNRLADRYLNLEYLLTIRNRMIGSGHIGGKAAGMLIARRILLDEEGSIEFSGVLDKHDSFFIGSDVFFTFLINNNLFRLRLQLSREHHITRERFEQVEEQILAGTFPPDIIEQFRDMLEYYGQAPIIVRSSSLLEDSFGNAFAGKYRSEFCPNQGSPEERLEAFLRAVKLVYSSALDPDALSYRKKRGLTESDEQMAILVQRVSGMPYKDCFFPPLAGVAFSRNLYAWNNRIDPKKGVIRLVFGLGTRAVNRIGDDYPRMIAISHPHLRPELGTKIAKYSQREMDLLDLKNNEFVTYPVTEVLSDRDYPELYLFISLMKDDYLYDPFAARLKGSNERFILTFNHLLRKTDFVKILGEMMAKLEMVYQHPVDTEFTAFVDSTGSIRINLLQCRTLWVPGASGPVQLPKNISRKNILFKSERVVTGGIIQNIRYILYIDPIRYSSITNIDVKKSIGRIVGHINEHPLIIEGRLILMGPGRWGSSNIDLGVNVGFADISNTSVLVEIAREEASHMPEVSFGTHFFQDLVEAHIIYLPLYPDDPQAEFNEEFFRTAPNFLSELYPDATEFEDIVQVIDVSATTDGALSVHVVADPETQKAVCFLQKSNEN